MRGYEILHSGQYWQDLHRRRQAKQSKAAREAHVSAPHIPEGKIFTFVPGRSQPYTSTRDASGRMVPVMTPAASAPQDEAQIAILAQQQKRRLKSELLRRAVRAKELQQQARDADAHLLARLTGKNGTSD
ncbi:hypothetical protein K438DRAFT_1986710 [Mycena galopus ATCC 62051]|nr:hypothetical protein K438DRAFT_1986710 [Mycena galopus ATCC 62051]